MDDTKRMLTVIINGQSALKAELLEKIDHVDQKLGNKIDSLDKKIDKVEANLTKRMDKIDSDKTSRRGPH